MKLQRINNLTEKAKDMARVILFCLIVVFVLSLTRNIMGTNQAKIRVNVVKERVTKLEKENGELARRLVKVQSAEYVEKQLRDNLGLAKPGEVVVVMPAAEAVKKLAPKLAAEEEVLPEPIWKRWVKLFI